MIKDVFVSYNPTISYIESNTVYTYITFNNNNFIQRIIYKCNHNNVILHNICILIIYLVLYNQNTKYEYYESCKSLVLYGDKEISGEILYKLKELSKKIIDYTQVINVFNWLTKD